MPRTARASVGGLCCHVLHRGNGRADVFHEDGDFSAFLQLMADANERLPMWILGYVLMHNHFHLVLWPRKDGDLSRWMQWLMTAHVRRYHRHYHGSGHVWQGRFKAFPIQQKKPQTEADVAAMQRSPERGTPFGSDRWVGRIARRLGLESAVRPRGRPCKYQTK